MDLLRPPTREFGRIIAEGLRRDDNGSHGRFWPSTDVVALGICKRPQPAGARPGKDVAVIGFDDVSEAAYAVPALSTIAVDPQGPR